MSCRAAGAFVIRRRGASRLLAIVGVIAGLALGVGVAAPANAVTPYIPGVPDPLYPHHVVYYDSAGSKWVDMLDAVKENDALAQRALAAKGQAQAVPGSFWTNKINAVKNGTAGNLGSTARVVEQGNLTRYQSTALLVKEKVITVASHGDDAVAAATKFGAPMTAAGKVAKGANAVGLSMLSFEAGTLMGTGLIRAFGYKDEMLCSQASNLGPVVTAVGAAVTHSDCTAWTNALAEAQRNADSMQTTYTSMCVGGRCYTITNFVERGANAMALICMTMSGPATQNYSLIGHWSNGEAYSIGIGSYSSYDNPGCSQSADVGRTAYRWNDPVAGAPVSYAIAGSNTGVSAVMTPKVTKTDPSRTWKSTIKYTDGTTSSKNSLPFKESEESFAPILNPVPIVGKIPEKITVTEEGGPGVAPVVSDQAVTPEFKEWLAKYPECVDGTCLLDLRTKGASCFAGETDCAGWFESPTRDADYTCKYGKHAVALSECYGYAKLFNPGVATGATPLADPTTGEPTTGGSTVDSPDSKPLMDKGVAAADKPRNCFPGGWAALNPVNWVVQPVQCALEWAFVPRASVLKAQLDTGGAAFKTKMPGQLQSVVGSWHFVAPAASCGGLRLDLGWLPGGKVMTIMNSCEVPFRDMAMWTRVFCNLAFAVLGIGAITRYLAKVFNFEGVGK